MRTTPIEALLEMEQSIWLDDLSREMTRSGELHTSIERGVRGITSNPTIFEQAISHSLSYDDDLNRWSMSPETDRDVYERLAIQDVREAADVFRPVTTQLTAATASSRSKSRPVSRVIPTAQ